MALEDFKTNCTTCGLILSDISMPGMNGYEFVKKAKEIDKQVKVVLMSAFEIEDRVPQYAARRQGRCLSSKTIFYTAAQWSSTEDRYLRK